jgi:hypothetical protein
MAITFAGSDFFADPGPLIIPVSVVAGGEKRGMAGLIVRAVPDLAKAVQSARRTGRLKAGGSFTVHLCEQYNSTTRTAILMGLSIDPGSESSARAAWRSIAAQIKEWDLSEAALNVPSKEALTAALKAIETESTTSSYVIRAILFPVVVFPSNRCRI